MTLPEYGINADLLMQIVICNHVQKFLLCQVELASPWVWMHPTGDVRCAIVVKITWLDTHGTSFKTIEIHNAYCLDIYLLKNSRIYAVHACSVLIERIWEWMHLLRDSNVNTEQYWMLSRELKD